MAVQRHFARPSIEIRGERLAKERLRRGNAAVTRSMGRTPKADRRVDRDVSLIRWSRLLGDRRIVLSKFFGQKISEAR